MTALPWNRSGASSSKSGCTVSGLRHGPKPKQQFGSFPDTGLPSFINLINFRYHFLSLFFQAFSGVHCGWKVSKIPSSLTCLFLAAKPGTL